MIRKFLTGIIALTISAAQVDAVGMAMPVADAEAVTTVDKADLPAMRPAEGGIELISSPSESTVFMVYSITGQLVKKVEVEASAQSTITLPGGCYVVRCAAWAKKIAVR